MSACRQTNRWISLAPEQPFTFHLSLFTNSPLPIRAIRVIRGKIPPSTADSADYADQNRGGAAREHARMNANTPHASAPSSRLFAPEQPFTSHLSLFTFPSPESAPIRVIRGQILLQPRIPQISRIRTRPAARESTASSAPSAVPFSSSQPRITQISRIREPRTTVSRVSAYCRAAATRGCRPSCPPAALALRAGPHAAGVRFSKVEGAVFFSWIFRFNRPSQRGRFPRLLHSPPKAIAAVRAPQYNPSVERIVKKSRSFREADRWDIRQNLALTPEQRIQIAHALRKRAYPGKAKDIRECHRAR